MKKIIQPLDLRKQYKTHKTIIFRKIKQVLEDGVFILGENVKIFEKEFAQFCGCRYAV
ncbi:MAG: DegT/DnrJ/EryC1/StrS family aminotransferase, partial [Elusimicrobiota bacterium]